jgi:hypothetical protein
VQKKSSSAKVTAHGQPTPTVNFLKKKVVRIIRESFEIEIL